MLYQWDNRVTFGKIVKKKWIVVHGGASRVKFQLSGKLSLPGTLILEIYSCGSGYRDHQDHNLPTPGLGPVKLLRLSWETSRLGWQKG